MRRRLAALVFITMAGAGAWACGADSARGPRDDASGSDAASPDGSGPIVSDAGDAARPPIDAGPRPVFPAATPSLTGFKLVDAFPKTKLSGSVALAFPKDTTIAPFQLNYQGYIVQFGGNVGFKVSLDFTAKVQLEREGGALGLALHPKFSDPTAPKPYAYVWYNAKGTPKNKNRLARFTWVPETEIFDPASEQILVDQEEDGPFHNGGHIEFGPDGFLYFANGDDEFVGDAIENQNHQRVDRGLFAGIFRIDVDQIGGTVSHAPPRQPLGGTTANYFIPTSNPFVGRVDTLEEFYALGLRNPYMFSFDRDSGDLWLADVGETFREEINKIVPGGNYEYPDREGDRTFSPTPVTIGTREAPVFSYAHFDIGDLSAVVGGVVYRGTKFPKLVGKYIYSDWVSGRVWMLDLSTNPPKRTTLIDHNWQHEVLAIEQDNEGELYFLSWDVILRLKRDDSGAAIPKLLSETRIFPDMSAMTPHPALVPYEINSPLWSDGADKGRWVSVPEGRSISIDPDGGALKRPVGTYLVKHFELPKSVDPHGRTRRLETRIMVDGAETMYGLAYRWNAEGTDATLVREPLDDDFQDDASGQRRIWHFPNSGECWSCHRSENRVLGFTLPQLNRSVGGENQVASLIARGVFASSTTATSSLPSPADTAATVEQRALSYLAANCAPCHHPRDQFDGYWDARYETPLAARKMLEARGHNVPVAGALGLPATAPVIAPGDPAGSLLLARVKSNDPDLRMPPMARNVVDAEGAAILDQWIKSLPP
jgi:uncharacterized repeat protein (TIGR03806 family)